MPAIRLHGLTAVLGWLLLAGPAGAQEIPGWNLVWHDEFDGPELDPEKWSHCKRGRSDWNNTMSDDARCFALKNGRLQLRGLVNDPADRNTAPFLTGGVTTRGKFDFTYGKVVIRARFKSARGAWPALWMLGSGGGWPDGGEIDLMEHLNFDDKVYQTVHSAYTQAGHKQDPPASSTSPIDRDAFNTYGLEWYEDRLELTCNGKTTMTYPRRPEKGAGQWPFDGPFYFILSMQVGGKWVGEADPGDYPAGMEIDWIRVYQKPRDDS